MKKKIIYKFNIILHTPIIINHNLNIHLNLVFSPIHSIAEIYIKTVDSINNIK